ncbi:hypothetical protein BN59_00260 [Legionella massiliensis]|uniref:Putative auto-transporter adhesin head GIN domain-containing protein n=1 Tax=Legionella massiliensis TaxID=1034943 RepID=A0A078KSF8_9GAMM|nr:DUF2807 domain-containing protein [Legionella massiliensis]CDZ75996.1 hypothetical protein BN59_00260 [Legionella massiliensis]CEE11734.1 hypothetical protein BN1094_00260 [Legionella massiliensis]
MLTRYFSLIFVVLLLIGCSSYHAKPLPPGQQSNVQSRPMPEFNKVAVRGTVNVSLHTGYRHPSVILHGDPRDLILITTAVNKDTLTVSASKGAPHYGAVTVEIRGHYLNAFSYDGTGTIRGPNIHSGLLDLDIDNSGETTLGGSIVLRKLKASGGGNVQVSGVKSQYLQLDISGKTKVLLAGVINISKLDLKGEGMLSMYWINSPQLTFCGKGKVNVQLAGVVDKLDVELWGNSRFNGRYLRAKNAFVKTHDKAVAELTAIKHQHTLATDASDIYYYKIPNTKADFMAYQGAVLDMRDWNRDDLRDYDRYNKEPH